jgi:oligopeptide transport system substrate-binding protein
MGASLVKALVNIFNKFIAFVFCLYLLTACTQIKPSFEKDTLRINIGSEPPSLDWHVAVDSTSFDVVSNLMTGLTQYRPDLSCAPACAKNWEVLDKGKRYIFHLREDIFWSDGKRLTAHDFCYGWLRMLNPNTAAQYAYFLYDIENAFEFNTGKIKDESLVGVKALDDNTLEVKLKKPAAYFINLTAICPSYPMRKDIIEKWQDKWTDVEHMVVNGPFLLSRWEHEYKIELSANPNYFEGKPKLKKIKMFMIPEQATAFALYENNQLDFIDNRSFATPDVYRYKSSPEYLNVPLLRNNYIGFNVLKMPFADARIRQAISMAIDRSIFPLILRRNELPTSSWIPPSLSGYSKNSGFVYDVNKAKSLLAQAGYPSGKNFPKVSLLFPTREDTKLVMEAIQDQLKRNLNINIELVNQEWKVYLATLRRDAPPMFRSSWGADYPDPETFMNLFTSYSGNNDTSWKNTQYDKLIERAEAEQNSKLRAVLYARADRLLCHDQAVIAPTYLSTQNAMVKPWVHGIALNALDLQFFKTVTIDNEFKSGDK